MNALLLFLIIVLALVWIIYVIVKKIMIAKGLTEQEIALKKKKILLIITCSVIVVLLVLGRITVRKSNLDEYSQNIGSDTVTDNLRNNLENLNGEWGFKNVKDDETWWLQICYDPASRSGKYVLSRKYDSWGEKRDEPIKTISEGPFSLIEGYDRHGDKAYVGKNTFTGTSIFVVTQLENKYAIDWLLRISLIEDKMFGENMSKLSNECE